MATSFAFTARFPVYRERIVSRIFVSPMRNEGAVSLKCLWDTGASVTVISSRAADMLRLKVTDETVAVRSGLGARTSAPVRQAYLHIILGSIPIKQKVIVLDRPSSEDDCDVVLGMDFISHGSFATSYDGRQLMFSFCYPPAPIPIDFTDILPQLGLQPDIHVCEAADNEDPAIRSDSDMPCLVSAVSARMKSQE